MIYLIHTTFFSPKLSIFLVALARAYLGNDTKCLPAFQTTANKQQQSSIGGNASVTGVAAVVGVNTLLHFSGQVGQSGEAAEAAQRQHCSSARGK
jgi:hypothetical protein